MPLSSTRKALLRMVDRTTISVRAASNRAPSATGSYHRMGSYHSGARLLTLIAAAMTAYHTGISHR